MALCVTRVWLRGRDSTKLVLLLIEDTGEYEDRPTSQAATTTEGVMTEVGHRIWRGWRVSGGGVGRVFGIRYKFLYNIGKLC